MSKPTAEPITDDPGAIRRLAKRRKLPAAVKDVEVELGDDWAGDPAVWVWLVVEEDQDPSAAKIEALASTADSISTDLLKDKTFKRWPYVRVRVASHAR